MSIAKRFIESIGTSKWEILIDKYEMVAKSFRGIHARFLDKNKRKSPRRFVDGKNTRED